MSIDEVGEDRNMLMNFNIRLNHIKLIPPIYSSQISYVENALIHPIASYMNVHSKHIGLSFDMKMDEKNFNGAWTPGEAGFWDQLSQSVYNALRIAIAEQQKQTDFKQLMFYVRKYLLN